MVFSIFISSFISSYFNSSFPYESSELDHDLQISSSIDFYLSISSNSLCLITSYRTFSSSSSNFFCYSFSLRDSLVISSSSSFIICSSSRISCLVICFQTNFSSSSFFLLSHLYSQVKLYSASLRILSASSACFFFMS